MSELATTPGFLLLEDGTLFHGRIRATGLSDHATGRAPTVAEIVFSTNMTGYQEMFTDPSFGGQIVVMTAPQIGNYGVNTEDPESARPQVAGVVVRELSRTYSNWRASGDLEAWLTNSDVPILQEVDTRRLTRHLRSAGVMRGVIAAGDSPSDEARAALAACPSMEGLDLASRVTTRERYTWGNPGASRHIIAYDFGIKRNILRLFAEHDARVTVVPADTPASAVLSEKPDGVFLSNGPGDPDAITYAPDTVSMTRKYFGTDGIWHLPRTPGTRPRLRRLHHEAAVRSSGRKSSCAGNVYGSRLDNLPESWVCGRGRRVGSEGRIRPRGHSREPERRDNRRVTASRPACFRRAVSSRSRPRTA